MQFRENLADRQAAEAVQARIDWKYLLGLALTDPGFDFSVLSEFRDRLLAGSAEELLLDKLLERCRALGWSRAAVAVGLAEHRTVMRCLGAQSAFSGRKRWEEHAPEAAEALRQLAEAHAQQDRTF